MLVQVLGHSKLCPRLGVEHEGIGICHQPQINIYNPSGLAVEIGEIYFIITVKPCGGAIEADIGRVGGAKVVRSES